MTNLWQSWWPRTLVHIRGTDRSFAQAALAAVLLLLLPLPALAAPHSRAKRPLPTSLRSASLSAPSTYGGGRARKGALKSKTGARAQGAGTAKRSSSKARSKAHGRGPEPANGPVPLFRAAQRNRTHGPHTPYFSARTNPTGTPLDGPAPLVAPGRHRSSARFAERFAASSSRRERVTRPGTGITRPRTPAASRQTAFRESVAAPTPEVYAEGISRPPDNDERLPRSEPADAAPTPAPITRLSAAPHTLPPPPSQPPVVQGFGAEIAVPAPSPGDRPGGTRRRNHPSAWTPEPTAWTAAPLEEREALTEAAVSPAVLPEIYDRNGRLLMPAPLKGSRDVLLHQNAMADSDGLERIQDDADLDRLRAAHLLVNFPVTDSVHINEDLPANRRVARPWTVLFAGDLAHAFYARFREPIYITSAVRTVQFQARLQMVNGNAAATAGEAASPHLTGQAIDLAKRGMSTAELAWMRQFLLPFMRSGKIDVEEEFHQACFHVSVYRSYATGRRLPSQQLAQIHPGTPASVSTPLADAPARNEQNQ